MGEGLIAHETVHQWFGNSATGRDWPHLWLSEGFATYFAALWTEKAHGDSAFRAEIANIRRIIVNDTMAVAKRPVIDTLELLRGHIGDGDAALNADLAVAYAGVDEFDAAEDLGEAAYALAPANPAVADAYGWALYRNGDAAAAVELLQKAVVLAPHHAGLRWHLAQLYADLGRKAEARVQAQAALADARFTDRTAATAMATRS